MVSYLERLGGVVATKGEPVWAAQLWGAGEILRKAIDAPISAVERAPHEQAVAATRA